MRSNECPAYQSAANEYERLQKKNISVFTWRHVISIIFHKCKRWMNDGKKHSNYSVSGFGRQITFFTLLVVSSVPLVCSFVRSFRCIPFANSLWACWGATISMCNAENATIRGGEHCIRAKRHTTATTTTTTMVTTRRRVLECRSSVRHL